MRRFFRNIGAGLLVLCGFTICHEERPLTSAAVNLGAALSDVGRASEHLHIRGPDGQEAENALRQQLERLAAERDKEDANMAERIQSDGSSRESLFLLTSAWDKAHKAPGDSQYLIHVKDRPTLSEISALLVEQDIAPTGENLEKAFWEIAAEKDPSSCVNAIVPFLIRPTDPLSYDHVFGHPPSASQMSLVNAITTHSSEQIVGTINDNVAALRSKIKNTSEGELVVIVGHNIAKQGESPILKLASGPTDSISADELYRMGEEANRKIVILCCWASESGITDEITYNQAISMISGIKDLVSASATDDGVHVGLVSYKLPDIFDAVANRSKTQRWLVITMVTGVTGSAVGWEGYECSTKDQTHKSAKFAAPTT